MNERSAQGTQMQAQRQGGLSPESQFTKDVSRVLDAILQKKQAALPKSLNKERFEINCVQMLQDAMRDYKTRQRWIECDRTTVAMTLAKAAFLDLDFFNGEAYAIPYGKDVQFQTDYKGEIKLIKKYSRNPIRDVYAKLVRNGDFFEVGIEDGIQHLIYKPDPFSKEAIIGAFAVIYYKDGSMIYDTMGVDEIEHIRHTYSKAENSPAWKNSYGEMCKKTVLRRICKLVDLDFNAEQTRAFHDGGDAAFGNTYDAPPIVETKAVDIFENNAEMQAKIAQAGQKQIAEETQVVPPQIAERESEPVSAKAQKKEYSEDFADYEQYMIDNPDELQFR